MALSSNASIDYLLEKTFNGKLTRKELLALIHEHALALNDDEFLFNYVTDTVCFAEGEWFPFVSFVEMKIQDPTWRTKKRRAPRGTFSPFSAV
ncbi:hypothetical protein LLG95_12195 [bacterium]|nr:hypothetical protein [bacterium]